LLGVDLKVSSVKALRAGVVKRPLLESVPLVMHAVAYLTAVFVVLSPLQALAFIVVYQHCSAYISG
jgi:hypothetical protein